MAQSKIPDWKFGKAGDGFRLHGRNHGGAGILYQRPARHCRTDFNRSGLHVSLWEGAFALADVQGTDLLSRHSLALAARSAALRGEAVFLIRDYALVPCSDWELRTRDGVPTAYRVSISEAGGGRTETALAGEVLHLRVGCDPAAPYLGTAPLKRATLTASLLNAVKVGAGGNVRDRAVGQRRSAVPRITAKPTWRRWGAHSGVSAAVFCSGKVFP
jgi:hypothetical protein